VRAQLVVDAVVAAFVEQIKIAIRKLGNVVANDADGGVGRLSHILAAVAGPGDRLLVYQSEDRLQSSAMLDCGIPITRGGVNVHVIWRFYA